MIYTSAYLFAHGTVHVFGKDKPGGMVGQVLEGDLAAVLPKIEARQGLGASLPLFTIDAEGEVRNSSIEEFRRRAKEATGA